MSGHLGSKKSRSQEVKKSRDKKVKINSQEEGHELMNNEYMYGTCVCVHTHVERIKNTGTCKLL